MNRTIKNLFFLVVIVVAAKFLLTIFAKDVSTTHSEKIILGDWTEQEIESLMEQAALKDIPGSSIEFLSEKFLGTPYAENTLGGKSGETEQLTVNLSGVDCFTYIDYVESLRLSRNFWEFRKKLAGIRYKDGSVLWENRRHFFSDWVSGSSKNVLDVTREIGGGATETVAKELNRKTDGSLWLPGLATAKRQISYIPSRQIGPSVLRKIKTGDYLGIYSDKDGLDVSHTGIAVRKDNGVYLRHASSLHGKVLDEELVSYMENKPGLLVYRAIDYVVNSQLSREGHYSNQGGV
ncbi:MAG: DUF1460 domain-containing protein [Candidatus Dadabacteria bacterium]|nr:DUF1460 domain-containing protein [Candidatus Dadabacteria bacterium]